MIKIKAKGFTLIEVLIALSIIAIALTALIRALGQDILTMQRIKDKTIGHWVQMQGVAMVQLGLLPLSTQREENERTLMFGQSWYWRVQSRPSPLPHVEQFTITISQNPAGPFHSPFTAFKYTGPS